MTKARLLMLFALCAVCPATARAQSGILDWLQGGSGPGPYKSLFTGYEVRVWCLPTGAGVTDTAKRQAWNCLLDDPDRTKGILSFGATYASSSDTGRLFLDDPADVREVKERRYTVAYTHRFNKLVNVGGTIDFINFKSDQGNAFSFWRFGIGPRLVFTPFGNLASTDPRWSSLNRTLHLQIDTTWLTQGLKASDFGNTVSRYDPGAEFQVRTTLAIDFAFVLRPSIRNSVQLASYESDKFVVVRTPIIRKTLRLLLTSAAAVVALDFSGCDTNQPQPGTVVDEAMEARRTASTIKAATVDAANPDYFRDMDGGVALTPEESAGRITWLVWTGGNDRLWDTLASASFGSLDFLKTLSSLPTTRDVPYNRDTRWQYQGLVNEPCMRRPTAPDPNRYGLWLDVRDPSCPPDPYADATKYPGVKSGARGATLPVGSYYGEPSGVVGLRLFPNPNFDEKARKRWNAERYYSDPSYYYSKDLVRPYRVGMSCAFCHVGPNPLKPPADPNNPRWENLSSNVGAQYFWWDRIFNWKGDYNADSFFFQILHVSRPGTLDTSLVSTDNIDNPRTMNAVYLLGPRLGLAKRLGKEMLAENGGSGNNKQLNNYVPAGHPLAQYFTPPKTVWTPRVLKDGADSVGALGALNRVFINIGTFSEEWLLHFRPLIGGQRISPIEISVAREHSTYWNATEAQTPDVALFFLKSTEPHHLRDAPGGAMYLTEDAATLEQGKVVFAERCARCHSSKGPALPPDLDLDNCNGPGYLNCWDRYWAWTKTGEYKNQMRAIVRASDFLDGNYLSTDMRIPVTLLQTNACSPLATNALRDNIWDNFSSESYKSLPSVGTIKVWNPLSETDPTQPKEADYEILGGGRGFTRVPSLISLWSTAPFLLNNSVGPFDQSPSVQSRMRVFQASIEQMLWPERREKDGVFGNENRPGVGHIDRTTADSYIWVPEGYIPNELRPLVGIGRRLFPFLFHNGDVRIGPIPAGMPTSMLGNLDMLAADESVGEQLKHQKRLLSLLVKAKHDLKKDQHNIEAFRNLVPELLALSKCRDYVTNKGHYFGTTYFAEEPGLTDVDKRALIAFLKTF